MRGNWQDLRYAARMFSRHLGLPVAAVFTLTLGTHAPQAVTMRDGAILFLTQRLSWL